MIKFGKYNRENTNGNFDSDLVVEEVILELQSLSALLKNFYRSSIMYFMTKSLKPLLSALNLDRSRQVQWLSVCIYLGGHCGVKSIQILTPLHFSTPKLQLAELRDFDQGVRDVAGDDLF